MGLEAVKYYGYLTLNKPSFFKGGLPPMLVMILITVTVVATLFLVSIGNLILGIIVLSSLIFFLGKWATKIATENRKGDRDYLKSSTAFGLAKKQIRDDGLLKKILKHESKEKFNI